jgi:hypothetical protein
VPLVTVLRLPLVSQVNWDSTPLTVDQYVFTETVSKMPQQLQQPDGSVASVPGHAIVLG